MENIRVGIIGLGGMGRGHMGHFMRNGVKGAKLTAVCDISPDSINEAKGRYPGDYEIYDNSDEFFEKAPMDGVIIATPHYQHPENAIKAFKKGKHVLVEKPAGVYTGQVYEMNEEAKKSGKVFAIMFNLRTYPIFMKLKDLLDSGELGGLKRNSWVKTNWYRTQTYYDSGKWRGTWEGEGGGVLLNQDPHQLDLWQWLFGVPERVRAFMSFGKYHNIDVEDDVTAYVEYGDGHTGTFITSTGEAPGTDRLEVAGDMGKIVVEDDKIIFYRLRESERITTFSSKETMVRPEYWKCEIPYTGAQAGHVGVIQNWIDAILFDTPLVAKGCDGVKSLEISNAMHLSAWTDDWVNIPVDKDLFYEKLKGRFRTPL